MDNTESTTEYPLGFFLKLFYDNEFLKKLKTDFFSTYDNAPENVQNDMGINKTEEYYTHSFNTDDFDRDIQTEVFFADKLKNILNVEYQNSRDLIKREIGNRITKVESITTYIQNQIRILKVISEKETALQLKYPYSKSIIDNLLVNLNLLLKRYSNINSPSSPSVSSIEDKKEAIKNKVIEILGFLKGNNGNNQKIMTDSEHDRLIALTLEMIEKESVPPIGGKFNQLNITNGLLGFTFYVLHVELYGKRPRRKYFTAFLKVAFIQMNNVISSKFSTPYGKNEIGPWIPDIIKKYKTK